MPQDTPVRAHKKVKPGGQSVMPKTEIITVHVIIIFYTINGRDSITRGRRPRASPKYIYPLNRVFKSTSFSQEKYSRKTENTVYFSVVWK